MDNYDEQRLIDTISRMERSLGILALVFAAKAGEVTRDINQAKYEAKTQAKINKFEKRRLKWLAADTKRVDELEAEGKVFIQRIEAEILLQQTDAGVRAEDDRVKAKADRLEAEVIKREKQMEAEVRAVDERVKAKADKVEAEAIKREKQIKADKEKKYKEAMSEINRVVYLVYFGLVVFAGFIINTFIIPLRILTGSRCTTKAFLPGTI